MVLSRYENLQPGSSIRAIITLTGDGCGEVGPRFIVQMQDWSMLEMPKDQLVDFLNDHNGKNGKKRLISEEMEACVVRDFKDVLELREDKYVYTGDKVIDKYNFFAPSYKATIDAYDEQKEYLAETVQQTVSNTKSWA